MKISILCLLFTFCILISSCSLTPGYQNEQLPAGTAALPSPTGIQTSEQVWNLVLPQKDQVVFTIPNTEPWFGKEGDPRPDWKGWGAEAFAVAPDGTFWIADTAVFPNRLLHFSSQGELLAEVNLEDRVVFVYDLAVTEDSVFVLDISTAQPKIIQFNLGKEVFSELGIDKISSVQEDEVVFPDIYNIFLGERGELLISGTGGYSELVDSSDEFVNHPLEVLTYYGHTYQEEIYDQSTGQLPIFVDGIQFEASPDFRIDAEPFLGFNPDGSFALAGYVLDGDQLADHQVRYYDSNGEILGMARQHPQSFYKDWNHHLAFGPDGSIYQLLSNPDHSVQIVRLGFSVELPPEIAPPIVISPQLSPLQTNPSPETGEEQARNALIYFFSHLSSGNFEAAAALFGGEMEDYLRSKSPDETIAEYWQYVCSFLWCLPVAEITEVEKVSEGKYVFYAVFVHPGGVRFEIGACCGGDPAATPPVWQYAYPVEKVAGEWKVMRAPLFTP